MDNGSNIALAAGPGPVPAPAPASTSPYILSDDVRSYSFPPGCRSTFPGALGIHGIEGVDAVKEDTSIIATIAYPTARSQSIPTILPSQRSRRLSRKLPPSLTESLEMLAIVDTPSTRSSSISTGSVSPTSIPAAIPEERDIFSKTYTLSVAPPVVFPSDQIHTRIQVPPRSSSVRGSLLRKKFSILSTHSTSAPGIPTSPASTPPALSTSSRSTSISSESDFLPPLTPTSVRSTGPRRPLFVSSPSPFNPASPNSIRRKPLPPIDHSRSPSLRSLASRAPSAIGSHVYAESIVPELSCSSGSTDSSCGTGSTFDIQYHPDGRRNRETRQERKARTAAEKARFDESTPPTTKELFEASLMDVIDEDGQKIMFGDLIRGKKTIVIFIRHWFCSLCAQYIKSVIRDVSPEALEEAGVDLIIIGNGSSKMINGYATKHFNSPFKTYTDPTRSLYRAMGLTRQTTAAGSDEDKGDYLTETALEQTVNTLKRASKMPLRSPGHFTQLGGEFIFDGTLNVTYTHRMITTRDHAPIRDICAEAGVRLEFIHYEPGPPPPAVHLRSLSNLLVMNEVDERPELAAENEAGYRLSEDLDGWQAEKERTLDRIKAMRAGRRLRGSFDSRWEGSGQVRVVLSSDEVNELREFAQQRF